MNEKEISKKFRQIFGEIPRIFRAPGRVNLIGEHTDYNEGFVLPLAIDRACLVAGTMREDTKIEIHALDIDETASFDLKSSAIKRRGNWRDYVEGIVRCLQKKFDLRSGANLIFSSDVPLGAGLSSSAALTVSIGFALLSLAKIEFDRREIIFAAQETEHEFVGIRSGIMDQFASVVSRKDHALLLDCRSLETKYIPINSNETILAICDTRIKHELAATAYNERRAECEKGVLLLQEYLPEIIALRDVGAKDFEKFQDFLPEKIRRRCRHIITENARTLEAAAALEKNDFVEVGKLMKFSHESLRDDYEVSCRELDELFEIAQNTDGVFGSRMTGGGFGGCTVNLLQKDRLDNFIATIENQYAKKFVDKPIIYIFRASNGANEILMK